MITLDLSVLYPVNGPGNSLAALKVAEASQVTAVQTEEKSPQIARDLSAFNAAVAKGPDAQTVLANPAVLRVLLTANGMADQLGFTALATKALLSDPNDQNGLASKLSSTDPRWKTVASTFSFASKGLSVLRTPSVLKSIADQYAQQSWRQAQDAQTPGISKALAFIDQASGAKSVDDILGNSTLRTVVLGALGIPPQIAYQSLQAQELAVSSRMDVSRLQDPNYVQSLAQRYMMSQQAPTSNTGTDLISLAVQANHVFV